jgi:hypothetical protein
METKKPDNVFYTPEAQDIMLMYAYTDGGAPVIQVASLMEKP